MVLAANGTAQQTAVAIGNRFLKIDDIEKLVLDGSHLTLAPQGLEKVEKCFNFLSDFSRSKVIYGINTGFGPMAQYKIDDKDLVDLQYNLVRSHCSGSGNVVKPEFIKALMIIRLNTMMKGHSGVHPELLQLLADLINNDVLPNIYEHGGLGASGDLVQLAHLGLCLIGEGKVTVNGKERQASEVFQELELQPAQFRIREGLSVLNGTSAMTGYGAINLIESRNLIKWATLASAMIIEVVQSYDDYYSHELNGAKQHPGQQAIAAQLREILEDSQLLKKREAHLYNGESYAKVFEDKVQEYYSIRCVPQILGPVLETINEAVRIIENEMNSASDNPIIDAEKQNVYHGGNFHGDYVSLEMDKLKTAVTKMSMLIERQLNFLLNDQLNQILPPFVNLGILGLNLGMQGAQFVATSTTAENQTLSYPMYLHSIPSNKDNQDIVSMGANAAMITQKVIQNTFEITAVLMGTIIQAIDYLEIQDKMSATTRKLYEDLRKIIPAFKEDIIMYEFTHRVCDFIKEENVDKYFPC
jgi:histidine ammonia-lyase